MCIGSIILTYEQKYEPKPLYIQPTTYTPLTPPKKVKTIYLFSHFIKLEIMINWINPPSWARIKLKAILIQSEHSRRPPGSSCFYSLHIQF